MEAASSIVARQRISPELPHYPTLVHMFHATVDQAPDVPAVICEGRTINYRQFGRAVNGLSAWLEDLGVEGRRVVLLMSNSIEMDVALMAVIAARAQVAPANPFFKVRELTAVLGKLDAVCIITESAAKEKAREVARVLGIPKWVTFGPGGMDTDDWVHDVALDRPSLSMPSPDDPAAVVFTGGSTGIPKGVDLAHRSLIWGLLQHISVWPLEFGQEVFLNVAPMFHIWGMSYATWVPIFSRSTLVIVPRYDPAKVVQALGNHRVTVFAGGPAPVYMGLLAVPSFDEADLSSLKYCLSGGAPCPQDLHREWLERAGCPLFEGWGMSEGAPFCLNSSGERRLLSVGRPVPETEVQIVDLDSPDRILPIGRAGEVRVRGPQLMTGYVASSEETAATLRNGWLYTGDIGYVDSDGFLFLVDRKKDMVIVGGYNVYPREIDEVLFNHPKIREAATVGKPDRMLGEVVVAFVVLDHGQSMEAAEFFRYCQESMVKYKRPVEVHFVDRLPKTATNKINRVALREQVRADVSH